MTAAPPLAQIAAAIRNGDQPVGQPLTDALERIEAHDAALGCFREVTAESARSAASDLTPRITAEDHLPLAGAAIAIKDNIVTTTGTTCAGSRILDGYRSPFEATVVKRLRDAGAIIIGKTNCDEFGMGSSNEHCAFGRTRNPWDSSRVPGGSSGGSAAAVAAGMCSAALGSDTGGSVRQPASFCGVVGLKPSYGRVSRYGLIAYGSSLDQIGPITRTVSDAALILQTLAGHDPLDSTCADIGVPDYLANLDEPVRALRIGVPKQYTGKNNDPIVNQRITEALDVYRDLGATIVDLDLTLSDVAISAYYIIAMAEACSNLARYDGVRYGHRAELAKDEGLQDMYERSRAEGFGDEVQRRIILGTYVLSAGYYDAYYRKAQQVRRLIRDEMKAAFEQCDVLLGPTSPTPAFEIGAKRDPMSMYLADVYTVPANLAGICAMSIPCGFTTDDSHKPLPIGLQLQARAYNEPTLLRAARMFEAATDHHTTSPRL